MPRRCTICVEPRRDEIDLEIVRGVPIRRIAAQHSVTEQAIRRHRASHLPETLRNAQQHQEIHRADDLIAELQDLHHRTRALLDSAEEAGSTRAALAAIREARGNLELLARLLGQLEERRDLNIVVMPAWQEIRTRIVATLVPFPEAAVAVSTALRELDDAGI